MDGHRCLSPLMYKAKAHLWYGQDIVGSERWQRQPQQQSYVPFQRLLSSEDTTCIKEYGCLMWMNSKRTRKRTRPICFERTNAIRNGIMFNFYPGLLHFIQISTTLLASFSMISELEHPSGACWSTLQYSFSPVFAHLTLLQDSFYRCFLILRHIPNVALHHTNNYFLSNA